MLRPKELVDYIEPMSQVANDMVQHLITIRDSHSAVVDDLVGELFKWSLESNNELSNN